MERSTEFVLRQIHPPGMSAHADEATAVALAVAGARGDIVYGDYLEWLDPDAKRGLGDDRWTSDITKAKRFGSFEEAMACWKAQSRIRPFRSDGRANRPMTAYSVTVEKVP